jgi:ribonuclease P protein component
MDFNSGRACHETHIPTQQPQAQANAWFSSTHGNEAGSSGSESAAREGSSAVDAVTRVRFPRSRRLTRSAEFSRVFAEPRRSSDRFFTILARDNGGCGARLGLAISRRAARRAVERNRIKRLVRETFRQRVGLPSCDFVVMASPRATQAPSQELRASLETHFARLQETKAR